MYRRFEAVRLVGASLLMLSACADAGIAQLPPQGRPTYTVHNVTPALETESIEESAGDVDDPAIWVHPTDSGKSLVVAALKDGGLRVYDLAGQRVQQLPPGPLVTDMSGKSRFNNVDIIYGFKLDNNQVVDLAVVSDRGQDVVRFFQIEAGRAGMPLVDVTSATPQRVFPTAPKEGNERDAAQDDSVAVSKQRSAYGLAHYSEVGSDRHFVLVNQRKEARIVQLELVRETGGKVNTKSVAGRDWRFAYRYKDQDLREESDVDASRDFSPQFEGMVVDQRTGVLYAGQECVGLWRVDLRSGRADDKPFYETRGSGAEFFMSTPMPGNPPSQQRHPFFNPDSRISRDVEGLTIYYGPEGRGYLVASSQGRAHGEAPVFAAPPYDDSFGVFALDGTKLPRLLGGFRVNGNDSRKIDAVQECDGAEALAVALPGFPLGVFISQDGYDDDENALSGVPKKTNLKYTSFADIASQLELETMPRFDPRHP